MNDELLRRLNTTVEEIRDLLKNQNNNSNLEQVVTFQENFGRDGNPFLPRLSEEGGPNSWRSRYPWPRKDRINGELQLYTPNSFRVTAEGLSIVADRTPEGFTSGVLTTEKLFIQQYGWFEAKMRLPIGKGLWPAFWLYPAHTEWTSEIDIIEGNGVDWGSFAVHKNGKGEHQKFIKTLNLYDGKFHKFAVDWRKDYTAWYIDDVQYYRKPTTVHEQMFMILCLAVGSNNPDWMPHPDPDQVFPRSLDIEYVRVMK